MSRRVQRETTIDRGVAPGLSEQPLLEVSDLHVSYGETRALIGASLAVGPGEVHALIGENGCGKSTLVKTISGIVRPGSGGLRWHGESMSFRRPRDAQSAGIMTVFQETLIADELSVLDNLCLGLDGIFRAGMKKASAADAARAQLDKLGLVDVGLNEPLWRLPLSRRHLVAIARALMRPWELLILDEATSALDIEDREHLFAVVRENAANGRGVLYISHRMDEIENLAAKVTVLRSGETVGVMARDEMSREKILRIMSPPSRAERERVDEARQAGPARGAQKAVLRTVDLQLAGSAAPINIELAQGEVLGLAGLEGHGQVTFLRCLAGWQRPHAGTVTVDTAGSSQPSQIIGPRQALRHGVAYVPGDRKREGIFGALSVLDNLMLPSLSRFARGGVLNLAKEREAAAALADRLKVKTASLTTAIESLSGGNQQKVVVGRWIAIAPRILLLEDPMRGVDVTSKAEIMRVLSELVAEGVSLMFLSTEVEELVDFCDRVLVFREQSVTEVILRTGLTEESVVSAMLGTGEAVR
jgi:ABC-type sugar transport system ATPase subunit